MATFNEPCLMGEVDTHIYVKDHMTDNLLEDL